jgi:hypothetical protein
MTQANWPSLLPRAVGDAPPQPRADAAQVGDAPPQPHADAAQVVERLLGMVIY